MLYVYNLQRPMFFFHHRLACLATHILANPIHFDSSLVVSMSLEKLNILKEKTANAAYKHSDRNSKKVVDTNLVKLTR